MTNELVDEIWFGGKLQRIVMSDELTRAKDSEGKAIEELPGINHASNGFYLKPSFGFEVIREIVDFGYC